MKLSIVTTLYQSEKYIDEFCQRAEKCAKNLVGDEFEIVLVNDGSPDASLEVAVKLSDENSQIVVVDLSRNFGHHKAMLAGLAHAKGERVFLIDSDLEEEPEWIIAFSEQMEKDDCDVVFGVQKSRKGGVFERFSGWLFYTMFNRLTGLSLPRNPVTARLMSRRYLNALLLHKEREISIGGLFLVTGFVQKPFTIIKHATSQSTYSFAHKMVVMVDSITSFSNKPLVGIFYVGLLILILASMNLAYLILNWMFFSATLTGWTSVMASIWFLGGLIVLFIGVVGIYLSKIFSETKQRPTTIVRQVYTNDD
ncbi:MAG: glycosyltransferase family 2 protein [Thiotrichaceae bacterium]|nr:glycosyltransferase family 2 protein [Thiotrichaceae bacterium]